MRATPLALLRNLSRAREVFHARTLTSQWFEVTRGYLGTGGPKFPFVLRLRNGPVFSLQDDVELAVAWNVIMRGCYRFESNDKVVIDAGANIGLFSIYAAFRSPETRVFSIEPFPTTCQRLTEHVALNRLEKRITVLNYALSSKATVQRMQIGGASPDRKVANVDAPAGSSIEVRSKTLPDLLAEVGNGDIDYLKMDIEGSEHDVLLNADRASLRRIRRIDVEVHPMDAHTGYSAERLFAHLKSAGFRLARWQPDHYGTGVAWLDRE